MQTTQQVQSSLSVLLLAWAMHQLAARFAAMKPKLTAEQAAAAAAISGNPSGV